MTMQLLASEDSLFHGINRQLLVQRCHHLLQLLNLEQADVSIVLMDDAEMAVYNERYRNKQGPTNVLSFAVEHSGDGFVMPDEELGDILLSVDTARREAAGLGISLHQHLTHLIVHGMLHLIGYDHERSDQDAQEMHDMEQQLLRHLHTHRRSTMPYLSINVDHVATIRQARGETEPDPVLAAGICELAGAHGIVVHLREDRRHINERDVELLRRTIKTKLNLEMAAEEGIIAIALRIMPDMVTLVPEKRQELTTEGGLDVVANMEHIRSTIDRMSEAGIPVSLFVDPDVHQVRAAFEVGATFVELHTGAYCQVRTHPEREEQFRLIEEAAELACELGLRVNAGHGLDYHNVVPIAQLPFIEELSIGHAIISRAVFIGLDAAVREMLALVRPAQTFS